MNSYPSPTAPHQAVDQPSPRQQNAWWDITETPSAIADQTAVLESPVTWKEKQARTRQKLEQSIEVLKSKDLPGQPYVIRYLEHLYRRHCKWTSIQNACVAIFDFLFFIQQSGRRDLAQITRNELGAFVEQEQDRGLKPQTVSNKVRYLYAFFKFLEPDGIIDPDVYARKIKIRLPQSLPKAIAARDVARLFAVIPNIRDRALLLVLLRTGMRIGELLSLTVHDVDFQTKTIKIYEAEKNGVGRVVYLSQDALKVLAQWYQIRNPRRLYLFYGRSGPMGYSSARSIFTRHLARAGLAHKGYSLHCLRHTFATDLLNAGMRLECLQQLLGHAKIDVTRIYAKLSDQTREKEYFKAMAKIEQGDADGY